MQSIITSNSLTAFTKVSRTKLGFVLTLLSIALFSFSNNAFSAVSNDESSAPMIDCASPVSFTSVNPTATTVTVNFTLDATVVWYTFQYRETDTPGLPWVSGGTITGTATSKTISGLTPSTNYEIRGKSNCSGGSSAWSTPDAFSTIALAGCELPPVLSQSAITGNSVTLTWPSVVGAGWYTFRYKESSSGTWISGGSAGGAVTSKTFIGLTPTTSYDFEAKTNCASGGTSSAFGGLIVVMTPDVPTSSVISGDATLCAGSTDLTVNITDGTSPYTVVYKTTVGAFFTETSYVSGTPIPVSPMTTSTYVIHSVHDANGFEGLGNSGSATVTVSTPVLPSTVGVYSKTESMDTDGMTTSFLDVCNTIGTIEDAADANVLGSTTMSTDLAATVPAANASGYIHGRRTHTVSATSDGGARVTMYFSQADFDDYNSNSSGFLPVPTTGDNADPNLQYVRLYITDGSAFSITASIADSMTWDGNAWELTYTFPTVNNSYTFATLPSCVGVTVANLQATTVNESSTILTWNSTITTPASGWYSFQYKEVTSLTWIDGGTANNPATSKLLAGLNDATNYEVQVRRHCSSQSEGAWSSSVLFTTMPALCNIAPVVSADPANTGGTFVGVTWPTVVGAGWYGVRYKETSAGTWTSAGTMSNAATSKIITGLTASTSYDVEIRSVCPSGSAGTWASVTTSTTAPTGCELPPVLDLTATTAMTTIEISYPAVTGAGWYRFQYKESSSGTWIFGGTAGPTATTKNFAGLTAGTSYDFQAQTVCPNNIASAWSTTGTYSTDPAPPSLIVNDENKADNTFADKALATGDVTKVYPNPATDVLNVEVQIESADEVMTVKLLDMSGRQVQFVSGSSVEGTNRFELNVQNLSSGVYTLLVYSNDKLINTSKVKKN